MKKIFAVILVSIFCFTTNIYAQPKLEVVGGTTYDWGTVTPKDNPLKGDIKIRNAGNQTLDITEVKAACGCTTAPLDKDKLAPGETTLLRTTLNIGGYTGNTTKSIALSSNDPQNPKTTIYLKCNIQRALVVSPNTYISFQQLQVGYESTGTVTIKNSSVQNINLYDIKVEPANMQINLGSKHLLRAGEEIQLIAKVKPTAAGRISSKISMKTSHPEYPELVIHAYGNVSASPVFKSN